MRDMDALTAERDRLHGELSRLEDTKESLEKERAEIKRKTKDAAGDKDSLSRLEIETEQMAEAKRENDHLMAVTKKRLKEVEEVIDMQIQSDMT